MNKKDNNNSNMDINRKIREFRLARGYTLQELARITGLTQGYLSKMERSKHAPPFSTLETIATALNQDIGRFLETSESAPVSRNLHLIRQSEQAAPIHSLAGYAYHALCKEYKNKYMSPFLFRIPNGTTKYFKHDGEEFVYVLEGAVVLDYERRQYRLGKGDGFYLDSRIKHRFKNAGGKAATLLAINYAYRRF